MAVGFFGRRGTGRQRRAEQQPDATGARRSSGAACTHLGADSLPTFCPRLTVKSGRCGSSAVMLFLLFSRGITRRATCTDRVQIPPPLPCHPVEGPESAKMTAPVRRERRCDSAAGRNADGVFAATLCAQLRADVYARVFVPGGHAADSQGLAKASSAQVLLIPSTSHR
jgi:hypothetical protein